MKIQMINAVSTKDYKEFRCQGLHNEYYLYRANKVNGTWKLDHPKAGSTIQVGIGISTLKEVYKAAEKHANSL